MEKKHSMEKIFVLQMRRFCLEKKPFIDKKNVLTNEVFICECLLTQKCSTRVCFGVVCETMDPPLPCGKVQSIIAPKVCNLTGLIVEENGRCEKTCTPDNVHVCVEPCIDEELTCECFL